MINILLWFKFGSFLMGKCATTSSRMTPLIGDVDEEEKTGEQWSDKWEENEGIKINSQIGQGHVRARVIHFKLYITSLHHHIITSMSSRLSSSSSLSS